MHLSMQWHHVCSVCTSPVVVLDMADLTPETPLLAEANERLGAPVDVLFCHF